MGEKRRFGTVIRTLREKRGITLRAFAKMIDVSPTYLSKVERNQFNPPTEAKVRLIAKALDQDPEELLALAGRVPEDLNDIIQQSQKELATFLRTAKGLSAEQIIKLTEEAAKLRKK